MIRVPKARTSGKYLSIDIRFINICTWSVEKSHLNREIIDDEEIARISVFCRTAEMDFYYFARPRNMSVDLKYDVLCL